MKYRAECSIEHETSPGLFPDEETANSWAVHHANRCPEYGTVSVREVPESPYSGTVRCSRDTCPDAQGREFTDAQALKEWVNDHQGSKGHECMIEETVG